MLQIQNTIDGGSTLAKQSVEITRRRSTAKFSKFQEKRANSASKFNHMTAAMNTIPILQNTQTK